MGRLELIDNLWCWAKEELKSTDVIKNKLLLSRDVNGVNAWHLAPMRGNVEILDKVWGWAKGLYLKPEMLRYDLLWSQNMIGQRHCTWQHKKIMWEYYRNCG